MGMLNQVFHIVTIESAFEQLYAYVSCRIQQHSFGVVLCGKVYICAVAATIMRPPSVSKLGAGLTPLAQGHCVSTTTSGFV